VALEQVSDSVRVDIDECVFCVAFTIFCFVFCFFFFLAWMESEELRRLIGELDLEESEFFLVEPRRDCEHVKELEVHKSLTSPKKVVSEIRLGRCEACDGVAEELWICLSCAKVLCSRYEASHMVSHAMGDGRSSGGAQVVVATLGCRTTPFALSWRDLSFWCYKCDAYVVDGSLDSIYKAFHEEKFGETPGLVTPESKKQLHDIAREYKYESPAIDPAVKKAGKIISDGNKTKKILVVTGAGVSTAAGVPDFRSPGTGLYDNLQKFNLPDPMAVFDIDYFRGDPVPFYQLAKDLYPSQLRPTRMHRFIKELADRGLLLRVYTQNIDGLDRMAGIPSELLVEAHGSFSDAHCIECRARYDVEDIRNLILSEQADIPRCKTCDGLVKPDIVFFGEQLPDRFHELYPRDTREADLVIVAGTSLAVMPVGMLPNLVQRRIPRLLINRERSGSFGQRSNDVLLLGEIEDTVSSLIDVLGWTEE